MSGPYRQTALMARCEFRPATRGARKPQLTPLQELELVAWYKARCALGTWKTKAIELGVSVTMLKGVVGRRLGIKR